jgi:hypothetical protein
MLSRRHLVAVAAVISLVMLTLTAWGHRRAGNGKTGAASSLSTVASSTIGRASAAPTSAPSSTRARPTRTASASPRKPALTVQQLGAKLSALFGPGDSFSVAGYDLSSRRTIVAGAGSGMTEASIVKLDILQTALYRQQRGLADFDDDDVADMMEHSDNAAADRVFRTANGNSGLQDYNDLIGLGHTQLDQTGTWGLSTTSATDQLTLLKQLVTGGSPLNAASRAYALGLMSQVEADQTWGISAGADAGAKSQLKNGWLNIDRDNGLWAVNSDGLTTVGGHQVLLVVLSQHQPDYRTGVNRVEAAARQLAAALRG